MTSYYLKKLEILKRILSGAFMISLFSFMVSRGPRTMILTVIFLQFNCVKELLLAGQNYFTIKVKQKSFNRILWLLILTGNLHIFHSPIIQELLIITQNKYPIIIKSFLIIDKHAKFISFCLYCLVIILFVRSLTIGEYHQKFALFSWAHFSMLIYFATATCHISSILSGPIWFLIPVILIIANDIFAYFIGRKFGRNKLIKLSPNKTVEGFLGSAILTIILGPILAKLMSSNAFFTQPIYFDNKTLTYQNESVELNNFQPYQLTIFYYSTISWSHMHTHSLFIGLFVSFIGPFGGFFASGIKRAFNIKDFSSTIPGHGGFLDRFDCQPLVSIFVALYYEAFVKPI